MFLCEHFLSPGLQKGAGHRKKSPSRKAIKDTFSHEKYVIATKFCWKYLSLFAIFGVALYPALANKRCDQRATLGVMSVALEQCAGFGWARVNFLCSSCMELHLGFVLKTALITQGYFCCCYAAFSVSHHISAQETGRRCSHDS